MASRPLIKESLFILNVYGVDPCRRNSFGNVRVVFTFIVTVWVVTESLFGLIFKWKGLESMERLVVFTAMCQILIKFTVLVWQSKNFADVIHKMDRFWPVDKHGPELQNEIENITAIVSKVMKYLIWFLMVLVVIFVLQSIFATSRKLPFALYHPSDENKSPDFEIMFGLELVAAMVVIFILLGFDFFFVSLVINIVCELKLLKRGIESVRICSDIKTDTPRTLKGLYNIIDHHNLILECYFITVSAQSFFCAYFVRVATSEYKTLLKFYRCIREVREIYSFWLLNMYFYNIIELCSGSLSMIASGLPPSLESFSSYGFITIFYVFQLYYYCAVGQYLVAESENVSATAYGMDWWAKTQPELRRTLMMIIQRANKAENLTAGGMFDLNLHSFRKVTRSALSFFTLVNAVYNENAQVL